MTANGGPYFGEDIGRYGNRIAKGTFTLDQPGVGPVTYHCRSTTTGTPCTAASSASAITSGRQEVWGHGSVGVQLTLVSPNGDQGAAAGTPGCPNGCTGFPGELKDVTTYTLNNSDQLGIHYDATDESPNLNTVINLTNHSYFNLAGEASPAGSAYSQLVQMNADKYTPTDTTQIPLGYNVSVFGTPFDFTKPEPIGSTGSMTSVPPTMPRRPTTSCSSRRATTTTGS